MCDASLFGAHFKPCHAITVDRPTESGNSDKCETGFIFFQSHKWQSRRTAKAFSVWRLTSSVSHCRDPRLKPTSLLYFVFKSGGERGLMSKPSGWEQPVARTLPSSVNDWQISSSLEQWLWIHLKRTWPAFKRTKSNHPAGLLGKKITEGRKEDCLTKTTQYLLLM